jgi:hypothetical protein
MEVPRSMRFDTHAHRCSAIVLWRKNGVFGPSVTSVTTVVSVANDAGRSLLATWSFRPSRFGGSTGTFPTIAVSRPKPTCQVQR